MLELSRRERKSRKLMNVFIKLLFNFFKLKVMKQPQLNRLPSLRMLAKERFIIILNQRRQWL